MKIAQLINFYEEAQDQALPGSQGVNQPGEGFPALVGSLLSVSMVLAGLFVLLYLIWGAFDWITAGGDSGKIGKARQKIMQAIIGIIVLASTIAIYTALQDFLGFKALDFESRGTVQQNGGWRAGPRGGSGNNQTLEDLVR